jgi:pyruvate-ferredoxin/flavodoxin oxidoreductase
MAQGFNEQQKAVDCGHWPLVRFNPALIDEGKNPLSLDSKPPTIPYSDYANGEIRWRTLRGTDPDRFERLGKLAQKDATLRFHIYAQLAKLSFETNGGTEEPKSGK